MRADVFNTPKAQTEVGANPHHRNSLALGRQRCDSLTSHREQIVRPAVRGARARPQGWALSLSSGPCASPVALPHRPSPPLCPPAAGIDGHPIAWESRYGQGRNKPNRLKYAAICGHPASLLLKEWYKSKEPQHDTSTQPKLPKRSTQSSS